MHAILDTAQQPAVAAAGGPCWGTAPPRRVLIGHSLGGAVVAEAVIARPEVRQPPVGRWGGWLHRCLLVPLLSGAYIWYRVHTSGTGIQLYMFPGGIQACPCVQLAFCHSLRWKITATGS